MIDEKKENDFWSDLDSIRAMLDEEDSAPAGQASGAAPLREDPRKNENLRFDLDAQASVKNHRNAPEPRPQMAWNPGTAAPDAVMEQKPQKTGKGTKAAVVILSLIIALELAAMGYVGYSWLSYLGMI